MLIRGAAGVIGLSAVLATSSRAIEIRSPNEDTGGRFGEAVAGLHDVNGDGRGDVLVGAPTENPGASPVDSGSAAPTATAALRSYRYASGALSPIAGGSFDAFPAAQGVIVALGVFGY